jgi:hypothetical protein
MQGEQSLQVQNLPAEVPGLGEKGEKLRMRRKKSLKNLRISIIGCTFALAIRKCPIYIAEWSSW